MKKKLIQMVMFVAIIVAFSNCTTLNHSMREPNTRLNLSKSDFTLSDQVTAEAKSVKIISIDWARIFTRKTGVVEGGAGALAISLASIPVIGNYTYDRTANYSLYNLMNGNQGYDVVFYPQYETKVVKPFLGIGFIAKITTVKTTARLGKLNK
jgi:hypothetical protein